MVLPPGGEVKHRWNSDQGGRSVGEQEVVAHDACAPPEMDRVKDSVTIPALGRGSDGGRRRSEVGRSEQRNQKKDLRRRKK